MAVEYRKLPDGTYIKATILDDALVTADVKSRKRDLERDKAKYDRLLLIEEQDLETISLLRPVLVPLRFVALLDQIQDKIAEIQAEIDKITSVLAEVIGP